MSDAKLSKAKLIRRTTGGLCLGGALAMLALGETKPVDSGGQVFFAVYWLACLLLAVAAMMLAILDLFAVRREARQAQRHLFEETLVQIQRTKPQSREPPPAKAESPAASLNRRSGKQAEK